MLPFAPHADATVTITVPSVDRSTWTFAANPPSILLNMATGALQLPNKSPYTIEFTVQATGSGVSASFAPGRNIALFDQKADAATCTSSDKDPHGNDSNENPHVYWLDASDTELQYDNHRGKKGHVDYDCNYYAITLTVADPAHPTPQPVTLDPVVNNGDGPIKFQSDHHQHHRHRHR